MCLNLRDTFNRFCTYLLLFTRVSLLWLRVNQVYWSVCLCNTVDSLTSTETAAYLHVASHCRSCMCVHDFEMSCAKCYIHSIILKPLCSDVTVPHVLQKETPEEVLPCRASRPVETITTKYWGKKPNSLLELRSAWWGHPSCWSADDRCPSVSSPSAGELQLPDQSVGDFICLSVPRQLEVRGRGSAPQCVCRSPSRFLLVDFRSHIVSVVLCELKHLWYLIKL